MKTRYFAQVGLEPPRMPAQHHLLTSKRVCVCVCVYFSPGEETLERIWVSSPSVVSSSMYIYMFLLFSSSFPKLPKASEPENGPILSRLLFPELPPGTFFPFFFSLFQNMYIFFAFLGRARDILTEPLFFLYLYSSFWCMYDRDPPTAACLHFDQSRFLDSNNLSNLPFDLFAEITALSQL